MKRKKLTDAEGNEVEVEEYESFSSEVLDADPEEIIERAEREEEDDKRLNELADNIRPLYEKSQGTEKAANYWHIGSEINNFDRSLPRRNNRESWLMKSNIIGRLSEKLDQKGLSKRQMKSMINFNKHWELKEIHPKIPWSFYQELAEKSERLQKKSIRSLERLIIEEKITDHKKLREYIEKELEKKNRI